MPVTDNFNRASLGPNWTSIFGTWSIFNSLELQETASASPGLLLWNAGSFSNTQFCEITLSALTLNQFIGVGIRVKDDGAQHGYYFTTDGASVYGGVQISGSPFNNFLSGSLLAFSAGDTLRIEGTGNSFVCIKNGVVVFGPFLDSTFLTGGAPAVSSYGNAGGTRIDLFTGGELITPPFSSTVNSDDQWLGGDYY